jgi:hypothetical protein
LTSQSKNPHAVFLKSIKRPIDRGVLDLDDLLLGRQAKLSVFYAPLDSVNTGAKVVLLGLTPGWQQMKIAIDTYCVERSKGRCDGQAQAAAKDAASFAGMRKRIVIWLDTLGLHHKLGMPSTAQLFEDRSLLHTTSLIRYPVFVGSHYSNYGGHTPKPQKSPLLWKLVRDLLVPELATVPNALIVPMGTAVSGALAELAVTNPERCLIGFPHPSGQNGHGPKQFEANRSAMTETVQNWIGN